MKRTIYADAAATTRLAPEALEAMTPWLMGEYGNASQSYSFSRGARRALSESRETIARLVGAAPEEIIFTSGGTESDNWALKGLYAPGDDGTTLTSSIEHHAVLNAARSLARFGAKVGVVPVDGEGVATVDSLREASRGARVKLVSVMTANNEIGTLEPIESLASYAHEIGALFHTDAVQAFGHIPIDLHALGVDMASASAHKFNGPKGIGFLYLRRGVELPALLDGGAQELSRRAGTENVAGIVGMATALAFNVANMSENMRRLQRLESVFVEALDAQGLDYRRNGAARRLPGSVSISIRGAHGEALQHLLDLKGIYLSTGSACDSVNTQISHVIRAIGVPPEYAEGTLRVSFGHDNTEEDAVVIAQEIAKVVRKTL